MSDRNASEVGSFFTGFVIGGIVGAAVALLLAPQSGEETRTMMRDKGIELRQQVEKTAADARAKAEQLAKDAKAKAEEQKERFEKAVDAGKKAAQEVKAEIAPKKAAAKKATKQADEAPAEAS